MRIGALNVVMTLMQGAQFSNAGIVFDKVLLDAPCSGTGTIRKSPKTINMWNPEMVKRLARLQKNLIMTAWKVLRPGGTMVYSTCSLEPEENEGVIDHLLESVSDAKVLDIDIPIKKGKITLEFEGKVFNPEVNKCLRLWPQDNDTEGFFVAKLRKEELK